jgi:hypothetical protein
VTTAHICEHRRVDTFGQSVQGLVNRRRISEVDLDGLVDGTVALLDIQCDDSSGAGIPQPLNEGRADACGGAGDDDGLVLIIDDWWHFVVPHSVVLGACHSGFHWGVPSSRKAANEFAKSPLVLHMT